MRFKAVSFDDAARDRIAEAAAFEKRLRLDGVMGITENLHGIKFRQITILDFLRLEFTENRLTKGEEPQMDDLVSFVLMLSADNPFFKSRYARKIGKMLRENQDFRQEIICFFNASFNDSPSIPGKESGIQQHEDNSVSMLSLIDVIASSYGWSFNEILNLTISSALQLVQRILKRTSDKYVIRNGITQQARAQELLRLKENGKILTTS